jgi:hypothetical protein
MAMSMIARWLGWNWLFVVYFLLSGWGRGCRPGMEVLNLLAFNEKEYEFLFPPGTRYILESVVGVEFYSHSTWKFRVSTIRSMSS